jgi:hypothetical protein
MEGDGAPCLVEVFDSKMPIPAWRQVVPDERKAKGRVRIDPEKLYELTLALYGACGAADLVFWGSRSPCLMRSGKSVGIVMPLRREDT